MKVSIRFVHRIAPRDTDVSQWYMDDIWESDSLRTWARCLRDAASSSSPNQGALPKGCSVREVRHEANGTVVVFPRGRCVWHALVITQVQPKEHAK